MERLRDLPSLPPAVVSEQVRLRLPSRPDWIEPAVEYLTNRAVLCGACLESRAGKLAMALHEALSNSVVHGNLEVPSELKEREDNAFVELLALRSADPRFSSRPVDVEVDYDGEQCRWTLTDQGNGFDVERVLGRGPLDESDLWRPSGRGVLMMRALMDEV